MFPRLHYVLESDPALPWQWNTTTRKIYFSCYFLPPSLFLSLSTFYPIFLNDIFVAVWCKILSLCFPMFGFFFPRSIPSYLEHENDRMCRWNGERAVVRRKARNILEQTWNRENPSCSCRLTDVSQRNVYVSGIYIERKKKEGMVVGRIRTNKFNIWFVASLILLSD